MPVIDPLYDLVLMLDSAAPDELRQKVLTGAQATINGGGEIVNEQEWGVRQTSYEIRHKTDAEYHLLQFHGGREILERLQRTLRIADGVIRFRIIKLDPGTPAPPASRPEPRPTGITEVAPVAAAASSSADEPVAAAASSSADEPVAAASSSADEPVPAAAVSAEDDAPAAAAVSAEDDAPATAVAPADDDA